MKFYSPLRYPGGKGKVADYFKQVYKHNLLYGGTYVEPYAGGACVGLSLLFNEYASRIIINDIDKSIYSFWHSVLNNTEKLCKLIRDTPVTISSWEKQKLIQKNKKKCGLLSLGFSTFFLNRTNRSGIIRGGVIGGRQQNGKWKIDARYNKADLINRIEKIAEYKDKIELYNQDAIQLVRSLKKRFSSKVLFYFDPPYYVKGKDLYLNFYQDKDHKQIADEIGRLKKQKWIITYDSVQVIKQLYKNYRKIGFNLTYSAAKPNMGHEIMIFSDNLFIPKWIRKPIG
jgi:DNA adenine methylase